jgi:hypothetical protein
MKRKRGILLVIILLGVLAAAGWMFLRPNNTTVIKGNLTPLDISAVKSAVKRDMAKRLLPDYSGTSLKGLVPNLRAYFKYNIVEINSPGLGVAMAKVGDGRTVEASKHLCQYDLVKNTNGWAVYMIYSGRSRFVGSVPATWYPPPTNQTPAWLLLADPPAHGRIPTNLTAPQMSLDADSERQRFHRSPPPASGRFPPITNDPTLVLRPPSTTHNISAMMPTGPGVTMPPYRGSLTNLMPLGN